MPERIPEPAGPAPDGGGAAVSRARAGIYAWIGQAGRGLMHATPHAILLGITAAAMAPAALSMLAGAAGSVVAQQALEQLSHMGTERLSRLIEDVVARLRGESKVAPVSEEKLQNILERRLEQEMSGAGAGGLRTEITVLLRAVNGVGTAVEAAFRTEVEGLSAHIGQALRELSETVTEFRTFREDVLAALAPIQRDTTLLLSRQEEATDILVRTNIEVALLRRELVVSRLGRHGGAPVHGMPEPPPDAPATDVRPYPGLAAFRVTDAFWFHGRERLTAIMVNRLRGRLYGPSPLVIVGASGAGKSSLLRAGLIPELDSGGLAEPGSEDWPREIMTPGTHPLRDLAVRLARLAELPATDDVVHSLAANPAGTPLLIRQALLAAQEPHPHRGGAAAARDLGVAHRATAAAPAGRRLVLVIDQFEEIFTQCGDDSERKQFVDAICAAARGSRSDPPAALVVIGLRAGFVEQCTAHPELEPALRDQLIVGPMSLRELQAAIGAPARDAGLTIEDGLVPTMLNDLGVVASDDAGSPATYDPGRLPLLSNALRETWVRRDGGRMTIAGYTDAGGIWQAIAKKAGEVYHGFDDNGRRVARQVLLHMVAVRENTDDTRRKVSRPVLLGELPAGDVDAAGRVLDGLERERLITADQDTVQIAHEALLRHWPLLGGWIEEDRAWLRAEQQLTAKAHEWKEHHRHRDLLLPASQVSAVHDQLRGTARRGELGELAAAYLLASERRQARTRRVRNAVIAALAALVLLTAGFGVVAQVNSGRARHQQAIAQAQRAIAQSRQLAAEAGALAGTEPEISLLLSLEAYRIAGTGEAISSLLAAQSDYFTSHLDSRYGAVNAVAYDPHAGVLATAGQSAAVTLWNVAAGRPAAILRGRSPFYGVAYDPSGRLLAGAEQNGTVLVWNARTGAQVRAAHLDGAAVNAIAFSPDGRSLASAGDDGAVALWPVAGPAAPVIVRPHCGAIDALAFNRAGSLFAIACTNTAVLLWHRAGQFLSPLVTSGDTGPVRAVAFSPDGSMLAYGSDDGTVRLWDFGARRLRVLGVGGAAAVRAVAFSPDGHQLASGGDDDAVRLWDVGTGNQAGALSGPVGAVCGIVFGPQGHWLASADADATVGIWNIAGPPQQGGSALDSVAPAPPPAGLVATSSASQGITLWRVPQRSRSATFSGSAAQLGSHPLANGIGAAPEIAFSPDGATLATPGARHDVALWSIAAARETGTLAAPTQINAVTYRPARGGGPAVLAGGGSDGDIYLWAIPAGRPVTVTGQLGPVNAVAFSPDATLLASASDDGTIQLTRVTTAGAAVTARPLSQLTGHFGPVKAVAISRDGRLLASASTDKTVRLWDISNPARPNPVATLTGHSGTVVGVAFTPDGTTLASSGADHTILLWNVRDPREPVQLARLTGLPSVTGVAFEKNGHTVVGAADDGTALFWDADAAEIAARVCAAEPAGAAAMLAPYLLGVTYHPLCEPAH